MRRLAVGLSCLAFLCADAVAGDQTWRFRVWLGDKEIGYHEFTLERQAGRDVLRSEARFEVRLLFVTLYAYQHDNREVWEGGCLSRIESRTDANGELFQVRGERHDDRFLVGDGDARQALPACVKTFAYWNPDFLTERRLLNSQNGEWVEIDVSAPVSDSLVVRGQETDAERYRLESGDVTLDLWYSSDREWLALETETEGGRRLRYELL